MPSARILAFIAVSIFSGDWAVTVTATRPAASSGANILRNMAGLLERMAVARE